MAKMTQARRPAILGLTMLSRKKLGQTVILCLLFGIFYLSGHSCFFIESISEVLQRAFKYFIHLKVLKMQTHNLGYPRIGSRRELKKACESFWAGKISEEQLHIQAMTIRHTNWKIQQDAGVSLIPSNNFFITN